MTGTRETLVTRPVIGRRRRRRRRLPDILTVDLRKYLLRPPIYPVTMNMAFHPAEILFREVHEE